MKDKYGNPVIPIPDQQPKDGGRYQCTGAMPWHRSYPRGPRWTHPDATHVRDDYGSLGSGGSYAEYECPRCGHAFSVMLPD